MPEISRGLEPDEIGWVRAARCEVPEGDGWLHVREVLVQTNLRFAPRRSAWRLGRWTAKQAILRAMGSTTPERVAILAADDGAPEPWLDGERLPLSVSLSHREDGAVAAVAFAPVGIDLEVVEPRDDAFLDTFFTPTEAARARGGARDRVAALIWAAKESVLKVRRTGLRRDTRSVEVIVDGLEAGPGWQALKVVDRETPGPLYTWWRQTKAGIVALSATTDQPPRVLSR